jgi:hypothetical protein
MALKIQAAVELIVGFARTRAGDKNPTKKPAGRLAWSFYMTPEDMDHAGPYIDLSIMPTLREETETV